MIGSVAVFCLFVAFRFYFVCIGFACSVAYVHMVPIEPRTATVTGVTGGCELSSWCWELN